MLNGKIDKSVPIPLYFQLKEIIIGEIKNGITKRMLSYRQKGIYRTLSDQPDNSATGNNRIGAGRLVIQGEK